MSQQGICGHHNPQEIGTPNLVESPKPGSQNPQTPSYLLPNGLFSQRSCILQQNGQNWFLKMTVADDIKMFPWPIRNVLGSNQSLTLSLSQIKAKKNKQKTPLILKELTEFPKYDSLV